MPKLISLGGVVAATLFLLPGVSFAQSPAYHHHHAKEWQSAWRGWRHGDFDREWWHEVGRRGHSQGFQATHQSGAASSQGTGSAQGEGAGSSGSQGASSQATGTQTTHASGTSTTQTTSSSGTSTTQNSSGGSVQTIAGHAVVGQLSLTATAYAPTLKDNYPYGPVDYYGRPLVAGDVAVDPSVIPLGTLLWVTGYHSPDLPAGGFLARAVDTGGAIKGDRLDIFINASESEVSNFGIQQVTAYILGK